MSKSQSRPGTGGGGGRFRRWVRRRLIVNPSFQFRAMLPVIVFGVAMLLFFGVFLFYPLHRNVNLDPNPVVQAMLGEQLFVFHLKMWPLVGIAAAIACLYTLQRSLRVASLGGSRGEKTMHLPSLSTGQKFVLTAWLLAPPLYAYWRGNRRWAIYDLNDPDIQSAFLSDLVWAYIIGGVLAALLILIWKKED